MDVTMLLEFANPGAKEASHQFIVDFKDLTPGTIYTSSQLKHAPEKAFAEVALKANVTEQIKQFRTFKGNIALQERRIASYNQLANNETDEKRKKVYQDKAATALETKSNQEVELQLFTKGLSRYQNSGVLSNVINIKASVTEVGDANKFLQGVASILGALEEPVNTYAQQRFDALTKSEEAKQTESVTANFDFMIAEANARKAKADFDATDASKPDYFEKQALYLAAIKALQIKAIETGNVVPADLQ